MSNDEIADLADRLLAKQRRGEEPGVEFEIEFGGLTPVERDDLMALVEQRRAQSEERLEALKVDVAALEALFVLLVRSGAPADMGLGKALAAGYVSLTEVVEAIRGALPGPLVQQPPPGGG